MDKLTKQERKRQEDTALTRALIWFAAAMVMEVLVLLADRYLVNFSADAGSIALAMGIDKAVHVLAVVLPLAGLACALWCLAAGRRTGELAFLPLVLAVSLLILGAGCLAITLLHRTAAPVHTLSVVIPALAVLALVYYLYQREFFLSALAASLGLFALWMVRQNVGAHPVLFWIYAALAVLALACIVLLTLRAGRNGGELACRGRTFRLLPKQSNPAPVWITCALSLLAGAAGAVFGATAAFYLMIALAAWVFVLLVYYTVKMM